MLKVIIKRKKKLICLCLLTFTSSCLSMTDNPRNHLGGESSLYLQQHAENPVNWYPWSDEAWEKARKENKLVLVSIGYSSCHWCHVMEKETFTNEEAAKFMNEHFVCIKVDREERPDIDQVYMTAVQLMTGSGGWPLNCFTLPDGRPIYGGTYFPRASWLEVLTKLNTFYRENPEKAAAYAEELTKGVAHTELIKTAPGNTAFTSDTLRKAIATWKNHLDYTDGGPNRAPKFPLPNNYLFLLRYAHANSDAQLLDQVNLTLKKMAYGGIYDQVAGGFARYSTDPLWKVPHFEKMLYDNAQLISLYSSACKLTHDELYKQIAEETIAFLKTEMSDGEGAYFSAIDADSDGEEGKYYVWTKEEIDSVELPPCGHADPRQVLSDYYSLNSAGHWENDNYILFRKYSDLAIASKYNVPVDQLRNFIVESKTRLRQHRDKRIAPVTDRKIITSWNALLVTGLCDAFQAFGDDRYRDEAVRCANRILSDAVDKDGMLLHTPNVKNKSGTGFLEDYAFTITAFIQLYQVTFDEGWLTRARKFTDDAIRHYYDSNDGLFWFTPDNGPRLIARKKETSDNVIASSNSEMAHALYRLGVFFDEQKYDEMAGRMLGATLENLAQYPSSYSNWLLLLMNKTRPSGEIVIVGPDAETERKILSGQYLPDAVFCGSKADNSSLPLLQNRFVAGKTLIYICRNRTCKLPVETTREALVLLKPE